MNQQNLNINWPPDAVRHFVAMCDHISDAAQQIALTAELLRSWEPWVVGAAIVAGLVVILRIFR